MDLLLVTVVARMLTFSQFEDLALSQETIMDQNDVSRIPSQFNYKKEMNMILKILGQKLGKLV